MHLFGSRQSPSLISLCVTQILTIDGNLLVITKPFFHELDKDCTLPTTHRFNQIKSAFDDHVVFSRARLANHGLDFGIKRTLTRFNRIKVTAANC